MTVVFDLLLIGLLVAIALAIFLSLPAAGLGRFLGWAIPAVLLAAGGLLAVAGRPSFGLGLAAMGAAWIIRNRAPSQAAALGGMQSTVRSAMFEMQLDHDSGEMDGLVLTGASEGKRLSALDEKTLLELHAVALADSESAALLEAYLDRRIADWRKNADTHKDNGKRSAPGSGSMTKQEAYQILGLDAGSGPQQIREAHRRLMKRVHPDSGGSTFLASKINEAKDVLLK